MGAIAPSPLVDRALQARVMDEIVEPVIAGMAAEGHAFRGFLFVGLMLTSDGPRVIEFTARLGDPETQVILPLIDQPFLPLLVDAARGRLTAGTCRSSDSSSASSRLAGYPEASESGQPIQGIQEAERVAQVFHAGTATRDGRSATGGRC
jgi:phosphoribosylamine--glycine ligase